MRRREITLEEKLKYLREIENIHRLSKKVLPPKGTTWARVADKHLKRALGMPIVETGEQFNVRPDGGMHQHSPRTARVIERTLRNGMLHPDTLHSYRDNRVTEDLPKQFYPRPAPRHDDMPVTHYVQHGSQDLIYPHGHLQGYGFVPSTHDVTSHVQLEDSVRPVSEAVPSKPGSAAAGTAYT